MKKNEKETAFLIAVCVFISLLILSPFMFFLLSNEHKTETELIPIKLFKKGITKFPKKFTTSTTLGTGLCSIKKTNVGICQKI